MAMGDFDKFWKDAARQAAEVLNGRLDRSYLTATVDGFPVEAHHWESSGDGPTQGTRFRVSVPGWPESTKLFLAHRRRPLLFRRRCIEFDDADWDPHFVVGSTDPDMVLLHLTGERRTAIRDWYARCRDINPIIKKGQIRLEEDCLYADADEIVGTVQQLVELATVLTK
jgi:hypothetical protein